MTYPMLSGIFAALCIVAASLFARSFATTRDRLFAFFAGAFFILGVNQLALGILDTPESNHPAAYVPRLAAFALLLVGVVDKNRGAPKVTRLRLRVVSKPKSKAS